MTEANITVENDGNIKVAHISGQLDESNVDEKIKVLYKTVEEVPKGLKIIFDLEGLEYMNSKSIGYLTDLYGKISEAGGQVAIVKARPNVEDILQVVGLTQLIKTFDSMEQAKEDLAGMGGVSADASPTIPVASSPEPAQEPVTTPAPEAPVPETSVPVPAPAEPATTPVQEPETPAAPVAQPVEPVEPATPETPAPETPAPAEPVTPATTEQPTTPEAPAPAPTAAPTTVPAQTETPATQAEPAVQTEPTPTPATPVETPAQPATPPQEEMPPAAPTTTDPSTPAEAPTTPETQSEEGTYKFEQ